MAGPAWRGGARPNREPPERASIGLAFLARIVRFVLWLLVISWATWLLRKIFHGLLGPTVRRVPTPPPAPKPLYRDPWCGTHVSDEISHPLEHAGQVLHFCSAECRDRYRASLRRAASG